MEDTEAKIESRVAAVHGAGAAAWSVQTPQGLIF
jgi:hypothetical protein